MLPRLTLPPSRAALALLALGFALPGLVGHDPWKSSDAVAIEIASQMHRSGDWLMPRVAGEPWLEDPPLYHWVALVFAKALGWAVPFHGAARLASGFFVLAAAWFAWRAGGAAAALVLIGSVGLIVHAHEALPELATLAASCAAFFFFFKAQEKPLAAGLGFGGSLGIAFLATGWTAPASLGLAALAASALCPSLRASAGLRFLVAAAGIALPLAASWPIVLQLREPGLAAQWWASMMQPRGDFLANLRYFLATASWFAWPAWPLALWALWAGRARLLEPRAFAPLAASVLALAAIARAGPAQDVNAVVLLAPLALLAAQGVERLRRGAANALDWFGVMTFTACAGLVWLGYVAMMTGVPPRVANNFAKTAPGFVPQFELLPFAVALAFTLAWLWIAFFTAPSPVRGVTRWAAGVTLLWGTFATLWLPWADYQKSYRSVALQLKSKIPPGARCVARVGLGLPQRAALSYHAGIRTVAERANCDYVIIQGSPREERGAPGAGWVKLADVGRPGDKSERYRLYQYRP
jgi:4-amino-4-deoxy-L-arabinose transferase-like glycosyltransferase